MNFTEKRINYVVYSNIHLTFISQIKSRPHLPPHHLVSSRFHHLESGHKINKSDKMKRKYN